MGFVPLQVMEDMEDFRDYIEVPEREFSGNPKVPIKTMHLFDYMRKNLDAVENLANELAGMRIETISKEPGKLPASGNLRKRQIR